MCSTSKHSIWAWGLGLSVCGLIGSAWSAETSTAPKRKPGVLARLAATKAPSQEATERERSSDRDSAGPAAPLSAADVARKVDLLIDAELAKTKVAPAPLTKDEDFLRRVAFDLTGTTPRPEEVTLFGLDPDPQKRSKLIDRLLQTDDYATNWTQYWREVIYSRATDPRSRIGQDAYEKWMHQQLKDNTSWDKITTSLLTATGDVLENGQTALIFAQQAESEEIASEASRIFLGIQIQCANCHDHPTDKWKREQFHQLAAFFPRISLRPKMNQTPRSFEVASLDGGPGNGVGPFGADPREVVANPERLINLVDKNGDKKITIEEARQEPIRRIMNLMMERADTNKDKALTAEEIKAMPLPENPGRGSLEHYMTDLQNPTDRGKKIDPAFFVTEEKIETGLKDVERRQKLAQFFTSPKNPWFATAIVNRLWGEMLGRGFYMPIDDIGPERTPEYPDVVALLSQQFAANHYDLKWLFRTIANTRAYQRQIRHQPASETSPGFACASPTRLRSDQLFNALVTVLGFDENLGRPAVQAPGAARFGDRSFRGQFNTLFGFDPSTPQDEILGTVPQALFFMNGPQLAALIRAGGQTRLARIVREYPNDDDALSELYLLVLSRQPTSKEIQICKDYLKQVNNRPEAYEDLMWTLLNSTEFQTKR